VNKSSGGGCGLLVLLVVVFSGIVVLIQQAWPLLLMAVVIAIPIIIVNSREKRKNNLIKTAENLRNQAEILTKLGKGEDFEDTSTMAFGKDEKFLYQLPNIQLVEYASTGSTFTSTNVGVGLPLGNTRASVIVGGSEGQITKNPDALSVVDSGSVTFTNKRIVFVGNKYTRDFELSKIAGMVVGANGYDVRLNVTNRERISGLRATSGFVIGPGFLAAFALELSQHGLSSAKKWADETTVKINEIVAASPEVEKLEQKELPK